MPVATLSPVLEKIRASREKRKLQVLLPSKARSFKRRVYQDEDIKWLLEAKRGILGWAPGLGKTFAATEAIELPAIVTCPLNLVEQWREFIQDQYPHWRVVVAAYGDIIKRDAAMKEPFDVLLVNHDMWRQYAMPNCATLVIDEIHHFRNREAQRSKYLKLYAHNKVKCQRVYGLTATMVYKDVGDVWNQVSIIEPDPAVFGSYNRFVNDHAYTDSSGWGQKIIKTRNEALLKRRLEPYFRERTYQQVGMFLPERIDKHVVMQLDPKFRKNVYDELRVYFRRWIESEGGWERFSNIGAVLHQLRSILVTEEKLDTVRDLIDDVPGDEPVVVFVWYRETAKLVAEKLDGVEITGATDPAKRREIALTGGPDRKRVRVATMSAMSEGVDLSEARTVFFVEENYTPGSNYQAMTRVQRHSTTGKTSPILAYWIRYADTIDSIVHTTAQSRGKGSAMQVLKEALGL